MKTLERHTIYEFTKVLLGALLFFLAIVTLSEVIGNIDRYLNSKASFLLVLRYHVNRMPYIMYLVFPMSVMFSATYVFGQMVKNNEMISVYNAGVSLLRFITPMIGYVTILVVLVIVSWEFVVAPSSQRAETLASQIGGGGSSGRVTVRHNLAMYGNDGITYFINRYDADIQRLHGVTIVRRDENDTLIETLTSPYAEWHEDEDAWKFYSARIQTFPEGNLERSAIAVVDMTNYAVREKPFHFEDDAFKLELLSFSQCFRRLERMKSTKGNQVYVWTQIFFKIAVSSVSIILLIFSAAFAKYSTQSVLVISFVLVLGVALAYYIITFSGISLAHKGALPAFFGAFTGNFLFLIASLVVFKKNAT